MERKNTPLSLAESKEYLGKENKDLKGYISKFSKMTPEKAKEMRKKLEELDIMKMDGKHISKIIDILPKEKEELNKIFTDVSLDEDETNKIIEAVKYFK